MNRTIRNRAIALLLCCMTTFFALQAEEDELSLPIGQLLEELDDAIAHKEQYQQRRLHLADSLRQAASVAKGYERIALLKHLQYNYENFHTDSTFLALELLAQTPEYQTDSLLRHYVYLSQARAYGVKGLYSMAFNMLDQVDTHSLTRELLLQYYNTRYAVIGWFADFASQYSPELSTQLTALMSPINDTLCMLEPTPLNRGIIQANKLYIDGHYQASADSLTQYMERTPVAARIFLYSGLAQAYGKLGRKDDELRYLILTAIHDIHNGNTEYMALPILAQRTYELGQTTRAYNYLICSLEDANRCRSSLRTIESTAIFPIIDHAKKAEEERLRNYHLGLTISLAILALLLVLGLLQLLHQHRKLNNARLLLAQANDDLKVSNLQLQGANRELRKAEKIKEEYIMRYLSRSRSYLGSLESFHRQMYKLVQTRQMDELAKQLKSTTVVDAEQENFYRDFDEAFLNLYPNFIDKFNQLLRDDAQIHPKKGELLTTELRIFALIRLGETDSAQIAKFLNYSLTTIYNYRSRVRNNARVNKEDFERQVMEL